MLLPRPLAVCSADRVEDASGTPQLASACGRLSMKIMRQSHRCASLRTASLCSLGHWTHVCDYGVMWKESVSRRIRDTEMKSSA